LSPAQGHSLEEDLVLETGTTQIPRYVENMLDEDGCSDEALRAKLLEKIDQMYADKMIDAVDVLFYKETLEHLDSTPLIHKPYLVTPWLCIPRCSPWRGIVTLWAHIGQCCELVALTLGGEIDA
jgi:hypothetical protein